MENKITEAKDWISQADALLIGASNGLSIAEGYDIFANDERFRQLFADFQQRFGIRNVLEGCFYSYPSESDRETFFKRLRQIWIDNYEPSEVMTDLRRIVNDKPYFIITSNADTHLELSGFDADKVFEIEGTFERTGEIDDKTEELQTFIRQYANSNLVVLELGIGSRNRMIKAPLMQLIAQQAGWRYVTLNLAQELFIPQHIADRSIGLAGDISKTLKELST